MTRPRRRRRYQLSQACARVYHQLVLGYRVTGMENVPLAGSVLLAANHKSYLDPPAVGCCLPREIRYFAKRELFRVPVLGPLIRTYGAIPVDREAFDRSTLRQALDLLSKGEALLVFPEGTRIRRPGLGRAKEGIALLAVQSGAPVVPVWVGHTYEPARRLFRRIPVEVRFGAPVDLAAETSGAAHRRERYAAVVARIMGAIEALEREGASPRFPD